MTGIQLRLRHTLIIMSKPRGAVSRFSGRTLGVAVAIALVASALVGVQTTVAPKEVAVAADLSQFRAGNIIADELFFNPNTMSVSEIQAFLVAKGGTCQSGFTCLKDYTQTTFSIDATPMCSAYIGAPNESAATIIYKVAQACGISPKVILVKLQKEQSLVTSTAPSATRYRAAMGAGCPDTAACDTRYYGFFQQVHYGSYLLKRYTQPPGTGPGTPWSTRYDLWRPVGQVSELRFHPNAACGTTPVLIENQATHSLYIYTPYTPNPAALSAGYGTGDGCSSYGNRNFYQFYTDWFGSTQVPPLVNLSGNPAVLGVPQVGQLLNGYAGQISPSPSQISCVWFRNETVISDATECAYRAAPTDVGQQLSVTVTSTRAGFQNLVQTSPASDPIAEAPAIGTALTGVPPARIAETRTNVNERTFDGFTQGGGAIGPGQTLTIPVLGRAGVPANGVGAVVVNVTATSPSSIGFLTVFPSGEPRPATSSVNFTAGQTVANSVIARVGADGAINVFNHSGSTHVIVDISGWFPEGDNYTALLPARIAETRAGERTIDGQSEGVGAIESGQTLRIPVVGRAGVPAANVGAVSLNVTATGPTASSYLTVFPSDQTRPIASSLNVAPGQTVANSVIAEVSDDGYISVYNFAGSTHVVVDVSGWFPATDVFTPVSPARVADTRAAEPTIDGSVQGVGAIGPAQTLRIPILGRAGIPSEGVGAVILNVTATSPTAISFLTLFPSGQNRPLASNLNVTPGRSVANSVIAQVGHDGSITVYNNGGYTHVVVDITGWFPTDTT